MASTSTAAADKGKRPMYPEDDPAAAAAEAMSSSLSDPEAGGGAKEKKPAAGGEGADGGGNDDDLVLVADCGAELRLSRPAARMSMMLDGMVENGCAEDRIRVPGVRADILRMVAAYCEKHGPYYDPATSGLDRSPFPPFPVAFTSHTLAFDPVPDPDPHGLNSWDQEFITAGIDNSTLFEIILAANFLGIEDLIDLGCTAVANKMMGKTPEEIRETFDIVNDYTAEEEAEVRKQNAWAFDN